MTAKEKYFGAPAPETEREELRGACINHLWKFLNEVHIELEGGRDLRISVDQDCLYLQSWDAQGDWIEG